ncbi:MAG: inositol-1-monophosphatase [Gammaproteobacteria bacterium]|nr:inositol-1-monophosphatase [Gammaproteobacteria bacterium]
MHPIVNIATKAAREAGNIILQAQERLDDLNIMRKKANDFVTNVDRMAEQAIIEIINKAYPDHAILAEESGEHAGDQHCWIIDPLDGTTNFIHGLPHFSVSIAVQYKGKIEHAVVYDPIRQDLFVATRGRGARLNERRIRVSTKAKFEDSLLGTGFPYTGSEDLQKYLKTFSALFNEVQGVRRAGSAALDLAYVACGRLDGFWEFGLHKWDIAAGSLLVREAGGLVADMQGTEKFWESGNIVAANPKLFKLMLQKLRMK